jgi:hypothetical protein
MIDHYEFGSITINGKTYNSDVIVTPDKVIDNWWREEGHEIAPIDIEDVLDEGHRVMVVGTGMSGEVKVLTETKDLIKSKGIQLVIKNTSEAVKIYNKFEEQGVDVVGLFHLTC